MTAGGVTVTIAESTPEPPAAAGYTVSLPADPIPATTGAEVTVPVTVGHTDSSVEKYNAFDMSFSYDPDVLTAVTTGYGENTTATAANGVLRVQRYGADASLGDFNLQFTAAAAGEATVAVTDARVDDEANAATQNTPVVASGAPDSADGNGAASTTVTVVAPTEYTVTWEGSGVDDITGDKPTTVAAGENLVFTIPAAAGYTYSVTASCGEVAESNGTYTISGIDTEVTVTVEKTISGTVNVYEYVQLDGVDAYLITVTGNPGTGNVYKYNGSAMYAAANYGTGVYSYLVLVGEGETAPTEASAKALITVETGSVAGTIGGYDVNGTGKVDVNDAQLVYNMYTCEYSDFAIGMEKFLAADVNADHTVTVLDAVAVVAEAV